MSRARDRADGVLHNRTHEDTEGGRESLITFKGEQSGGEISTLAQIQASHDGTSDDQAGDLIFKTNDGSDNNAPTERLRIDSSGQVGIGINSPAQPLHIFKSTSAGGGIHPLIKVQNENNNSTGDGAGIEFHGKYQGGEWGFGKIGGANSGANFGGALEFHINSGTGSVSTGFTEKVRIDTDGLKFNGDTAAANALDDYEEGTWTVNLTKGGSALPVNARYGYYTKVGNLLYIQFYWFHNGGLSSQTNNSTQYKIEGMPYAIQATTAAAYAGIGSTYIVVDNSNRANDYHKWQVNATDKLSLTGYHQSTQHTTGVLELAGAGVFRT